MRADTLADFLRAPLKGHVEEVPGVGKDTRDKLEAAGVCTTQQLIGVYLRGGDCATFYTWLQGVGVRAHRNTVVRCVSEKAAQLFAAFPSEALGVVEEREEEVEAVDMSNAAAPGADAEKKRAKKLRQRARQRAARQQCA